MRLWRGELPTEETGGVWGRTGGQCKRSRAGVAGALCRDRSPGQFSRFPKRHVRAGLWERSPTDLEDRSLNAAGEVDSCEAYSEAERIPGVG